MTHYRWMTLLLFLILDRDNSHLKFGFTCSKQSTHNSTSFFLAHCQYVWLQIPANVPVLPVCLLPHSEVLFLTPFPHLFTFVLLLVCWMHWPSSPPIPPLLPVQWSVKTEGPWGAEPDICDTCSTVIAIQCLFNIKSKYIPRLWTVMNVTIVLSCF